MASSEVASHLVVEGIVGVPMPIHPEQQRPQWVVDERDTFISWLRGEFAAANAIIDALCQHLHTVGAPGEYDFVLASIQHRRFNWSSVLHMQQYYSVAEVIMSLQQASLKKQDMLQQSKATQEEAAQEVEHSYSGKNASFEGTRKTQNGQVLDGKQQVQAPEDSHGDQQVAVDNSFPDKLEGSDRLHNLGIKDGVKSVLAIEQIDGQQVNVLEGFEIRESLLDRKEVADLAASVKQWNASKNKSGGSKRSSNGKCSKNSIQFGTIPSDLLAKEEKPSTCFREETAEPIPAFLQSVSDRLAKLHVIPADKPPDACSIDVLEPGDYVPPHSHQSFDPPIFILSVESESTLVFGKSLKMKNPGDIDGPFKLALSPGSVLLLQGKNAQLVQCAVTQSGKLRILVTFGRTPRLPSAAAAAATTAAFPVRSSRGVHTPIEPLAFMHGFPALRPVTSPPTLLPVSTAIRSSGPQVVQPISPLPVFPTPLVGPAAAAAATPWSASSPPRVVPTTIGTGVFLPPNGTIIYSHMNSSSSVQRRPFF